MCVFIALVLITFCGGVLGGSLCPPENRIYPCRCINIEISKRDYHTIISCRHLQDVTILERIYPALMNIEIDTFVISDSFLLQNNENKGTLPSDWFTLTWIKELQIIDSSLSSCFGCEARFPCRNHFTTKLEITNSSSTENLCLFCNISTPSEENSLAYSGLLCLSQLKQFHFTRGKLSSINSYLFPQKVENLVTLNFSHNEIREIHRGVFNNIPNLIELDLSHNALGNIEGIFNGKTELELLDLSWNSIRSLSSNFFLHLEKLKIFNVKHNLITTLVQWNKIPTSLKRFNFSGNSIHCDCKIRWLDSGLSDDVSFAGNCGSPAAYKNSFLRNTSRILAARCGSSRRSRDRKP